MSGSDGIVHPLDKRERHESRVGLRLKATARGGMSRTLLADGIFVAVADGAD